MTGKLKEQTKEMIEWLIEDFEKGDYDITKGIGKVIAEVLTGHLTLWFGLDLWELVKKVEEQNSHE